MSKHTKRQGIVPIHQIPPGSAEVEALARDYRKMADLQNRVEALEHKLHVQIVADNNLRLGITELADRLAKQGERKRLDLIVAAVVTGLLARQTWPREGQLAQFALEQARAIVAEMDKEESGDGDNT